MHQAISGCTRPYQGAAGYNRVHQTISGCTRPYQGAAGYNRVHQTIPYQGAPVQTISGCTRPYQGASGYIRVHQAVPGCTRGHTKPHVHDHSRPAAEDTTPCMNPTIVTSGLSLWEHVIQRCYRRPKDLGVTTSWGGGGGGGAFFFKVFMFYWVVFLLWHICVTPWSKIHTFTRPEDGLRCRQAVKPPLKLKNSNVYIGILLLANNALDTKSSEAI